MRGPFADGALTENEAAATAMALLAFLGDGHTHLSGEYATESRKGSSSWSACRIAAASSLARREATRRCTLKRRPRLRSANSTA